MNKLEPLAKKALKKWAKQYKNGKIAKLAENAGFFWIDSKGYLHFGKRKNDFK